jgi:hypothetical protein
MGYCRLLLYGIRSRLKCTGPILAAGGLIAHGLYGQIPDTLWTKLYGTSYYDFIAAAVETPDHGYIAAGVKGGSSVYGAWILKTDPNGDTLWAKSYGSYQTVNIAYDVKPLMDGGYVIAGYTTTFNPENNDLLLSRLNAQGDTAWFRTFGGDSSDFGYSVDETPDHGYIITGYTNSFGNGSSDLWLVKVDTLGNWQFAKTYGGSYDEYGYSVQTTSDSGFIVAGFTSSFSMHFGDGWLLKTNASGDTLWTKMYSNGFCDVLESVRQTPDGGYILSGATILSDTLSWDLLLIRTDSLGNVIWSKIYGGDSSEDGSSVEPTPDGGYIVCGRSNSFGNGQPDIWILKTDSLGDTLWTKILGGHLDDEGLDINPTSDNGYILAGVTNSFGAGSYDGWLVKLGDNGAISEHDRKPADPAGLFQIRENPVRDRPIFILALNQAAPVKLKIYDVAGRLVAAPYNGWMQAGEHKIKVFDILNAGIYFYCLETPAGKVTGKFVVVR